jgi:hypothetical protein
MSAPSAIKITPSQRPGKPKTKLAKDQASISQPKTQKGSKLRSTKNAEVKAEVKKPAPGVPPSTTYWVEKQNGGKLWKAALDKRGWQEIPDENKASTNLGFKYCQGRSGIDWGAHNAGQLVCHIQNNNVITTKMELFVTLRDFFCRPSPGATGNQTALSVLKRQKGTERKPTPWVPETFLLNDPVDRQAVLDVQKADDKAEKPKDLMWIYKPSNLNRGRGLRVIKGLKSLKEIVCDEDPLPGRPAKEKIDANGIIQHYLTDPLLIDGYKFDLRCYMLIARTSPQYLVFYHPGYCRMTLKRFEKSQESLEDPSIHLTNAAIQKYTEEYKEMKEFQIQTPQAVADAIEAGGNAEGAKYMRTEMEHDIKYCMVDVIQAAVPKFRRKHGCFDLFGFDFMITNENKLVLIEVNTNPALTLDNSTLASLLPPIVDGTVDMVLRAQGPQRTDIARGNIDQALDDQLLNNLPGGFVQIYNEKTKFKYSGN